MEFKKGCMFHIYRVSRWKIINIKLFLESYQQVYTYVAKINKYLDLDFL